MSSTTFTVWHYDTSMGAAAGEVRLKDLQQQGAVRVVDAVTVTWVPGAAEPHLGHLIRQGPASIARSSMLGALAAALLLTPPTGASAADRAAALAERLGDTGIGLEVLEGLQGHLRPGTSALLVVCREEDLDAVRGFVERGLASGDVRLRQVPLRDGASEALQALVEQPLGTGVSPDPGEPGAPTGP